MNNKIDSILAELYQGDPSLQQHDAVLRKLVVELMELRPDTQFDERFKQDLRRKLLSLSETQGHRSTLISTFMKRFQLVGASVAFVALLAVSVWYLNGVNGPNSSLTSMLSGPNITRAGDNAFGSLANVQNAGRGQGGGGNASMADNSSELSVAPSAGGYGGGVGMDSKLIAPAPVNYRFVYKGEELQLGMDQVDVLRRVKGDAGSDLSDFVDRISFGLVNLNSFGSAKLQNFTFAEDRDLGYMVNVSLTEGSININENWAKWQRFTMPACAVPLSVDKGQDMACPQPKRISESEIPADQVLIDAADAFLDAHGIPKQNYGTPFVNSDWRMYYERTEDKANYWIPDVMSVVYPLELDGQAVLDESGNRTGLNVSVRISPEVRVSGLWELTTQNYQSSAYAAETDVARIMKLAENGGFRTYYYADAAAKTVDVELGTPQLQLVKLWNYNSGNSEELLVPSLVFPVTKEPTGADAAYWYKKNVVVPLVKEILDNENNDLPVRIMPAGGATEPAVSTPVEDKAR